MNGVCERLWLCNRRDKAARSIMVSAAPAEIINAFFVDSRPFLGTFLAS
ncbi:MAG: hypothetical protein RLZZ09_1898, partial [Pseudomonadota bacterium]